jgi:hypothetical protein
VLEAGAPLAGTASLVAGVVLVVVSVDVVVVVESVEVLLCPQAASASAAAPASPRALPALNGERTRRALTRERRPCFSPLTCIKSVGAGSRTIIFRSGILWVLQNGGPAGRARDTTA